MDILVIEDNIDLTANIVDFLESNQHILDVAHDGRLGFQLAKENDYDFIILDINLPQIDGLTLCQKLRQEEKKDTPILMLTAKDTLDDVLKGFSAGADDYLIKPFSLHELLDRLFALHARSIGKVVERNLKVQDLIFDEKKFEVTRQGHNLELTPTDKKILRLLMINAPDIVKRQHIEREVWGDLPPDSNVLRTHIHTLRTIIDKPFEPPLLKTVRGVGFCLRADDEL